MKVPKSALTAGAAAVALTTMFAMAPTAPAAPGDTSYTVKVDDVGTFRHPTDTPAFPFTDSDGKFYFQQAAALYGANEPHEWEFYTGRDMDTAEKDVPLSTAADPANPQDRNDDTVWRCLNGPTGRIATATPTPSGYAFANYCDLVGMWVDPDTGDWIGLVHNEFTPRPFGDRLHYDAIDYAVSTDHGKTWRIKDQAITSPFSVKRDDNVAFPQQTYYYGDGDPRLFVDVKSGYFYVYYGSRVVDKGGSWGGFAEHVARAPLSGKMKTGTWQKFYDGKWQEPGVGGKESSLVSTEREARGYLSPDKEYNPNAPGTFKEQQAAGTLAPDSDLFILNIAWSAHLGKYIGTPERLADPSPQRIYATDDLANPKWTFIGDTGQAYSNSSWYRWLIDPVSKTQGTTIGRTFRSYCSIYCAKGHGDYATITIDSTKSAPAMVQANRNYLLMARSGALLGQPSWGSQHASMDGQRWSPLARWKFQPTGDGAYAVVNSGSGRALGVDDTGNAGRAWGAGTSLGALPKSGPRAGQQWFVQQGPNHSMRLVNRYSGLVLDLGGPLQAAAKTQPYRSWTGTDAKTGRTARPASQELQLIRVP